MAVHEDDPGASLDALTKQLLSLALPPFPKAEKLKSFCADVQLFCQFVDALTRVSSFSEDESNGSCGGRLSIGLSKIWQGGKGVALAEMLFHKIGRNGLEVHSGEALEKDQLLEL